MNANPANRYSHVAIALHWVLGLALIGSFAMGVYMTDIPMSPTRLKLYNYHKWAGVTILALSALRLLWRLTHRPPADAPMPAWQAKAARKPVLLRLDYESGHGLGSTKSQTLDARADTFAFLLWQMGVPGAGPR